MGRAAPGTRGKRAPRPAGRQGCRGKIFGRESLPRENHAGLKCPPSAKRCAARAPTVWPWGAILDFARWRAGKKRPNSRGLARFDSEGEMTTRIACGRKCLRFPRHLLPSLGCFQFTALFSIQLLCYQVVYSFRLTTSHRVGGPSPRGPGQVHQTPDTGRSDGPRLCLAR